MDDSVVGRIEPSPDGDVPLFEIIRERDRNEDVRPCDHGSFQLDKKWATVTCGKCGAPVDAFAALLSIAEWWERLEHRRLNVRAAEKDALKIELRRLTRLRDTTDDEVEEIEAVLERYHAVTLEDAREMERRIRRAAKERKWSK